MNSTDVQGTLREMWETRPARPRHDRKVAGVAAAIARRYDIDPVLVRIGFVVAAFYGIGAALYIAGWVLLPDARDDDPVPDGAATGARRSPHPMLLVGVVVAAIIGIGSMFDRHGGVVLPALAALGLLFLLHRSRGDRGPASLGVAPSASRSTTPVAGSGNPLTPGTSGTPGASGQSGTPNAPGTPGAEPHPVPPSWDPLGAAPFAWDLPEPSSPTMPAPSRRRGSRVTPVTLALALLTVGVLGSVLLLGYGLVALPVLLGIVLAILGAGLVVGAFLHAGRWLIPLALLMCALTSASVVIPLDGLRGGFDDLTVAPTTNELAPEYHRGAGTISLDLRRLDLSVPAGTDPAHLGSVHTSVRIGAGTIEVVVPPDADLTIRSSIGLGSISYGGQQHDGAGQSLTVNDDLGADGVRSGRPLELDLNAGLGDVQVRRG